MLVNIDYHYSVISRGAEYGDAPVCVSVSLSVSVCLRAYLRNYTSKFFTKFLRMLAMAVARSCCGGVAIRYVLPVHG